MAVNAELATPAECEPGQGRWALGAELRSGPTESEACSRNPAQEPVMYDTNRGPGNADSGALGRSARVLEELAESTGEAIARIAARGDRIDRIQNETRALLNALVAPEVNG